MDNAKISWYTKILEEDNYDLRNDVYIGTYDGVAPLSLKIQLWNNRYGKTDVKNLSDFYLSLIFDNVEDRTLFKYCTVILNDSDIISPEVIGDIAVIKFPNPVTLKGTKNNGDPITNKKNYINLEFRFDAGDKKLKEDDLKSLYIKVIS